jgi:hypothetical protein
MTAFPRRRLPYFILAATVLLLSWMIRFSQAQEPVGETKLEQVASDDELEAQKKSDEGKDKDQGKDKKDAGNSTSGKGSDQATIAAGRAAFDRSCTTCHDAARSLERTKDLAGWRATVRRMAAKRGAEIATDDIEPISVYLASRNSAASRTPAEKEKSGESSAAADTSSLSAFATLSPMWRGGNEHMQNSGFGPLAWVGGSWQSKTVSARVTLCITCHGEQEQAFLSRIDIAEAAVRVDLSQYLTGCCRDVKVAVDAGRFIVPFGAFSAQVNPGTYRTVSTPLIFNMGQRLFNQDLGVPVLPMPYSDTGVNLNVDVPLCNVGTGMITASVDAYLVNGLQGGSDGIDFLQSRNLFDFNDRVAGGGRFTVGDPNIRAGASFTTGRFDDPSTSPVPGGLYYWIYGFDVQARYQRLFRCQFEYARRDSDRFGQLPNGAAVFSESVDGCYVEAEVRPWEECCVSLLARYDLLSRSSPLPLTGSTLPTAGYDVERLTLGINIELWHQSLLMINFERWLLPEPAHSTADVFGIRYTITF